MSNMTTTKSDFAQKLLTDLRVRKERMTAAQSSSRQSSQTSRVTRGSSGPTTSRGGRQLNLPENTSRRSSNGGSRSVNIKESSSQIVVYESGQRSSKQVRDLSMAIAFAFENSGNHSSNPLVNFFNRFGRRSTNSHKMQTTTFYNHSAASNIHINEISKGVHKLNQILTACSNGLNLDRNSIEIGRELLKGAVDLEESLRMLVNMQDHAAEYTNAYHQKKSRLKLLDEDEDEDEEDEKKRAEQWKLDRPRFSFDKTSAAPRRKQLALPNAHEPTSNMKLLPYNSSSSKSAQEKGRISNVVAKLMGLDELPQKEASGKGWKQGKVPLTRESRNGSDLSTNKSFNATSTTLQLRELKLQIKPENRQATPDFKMPDPKLATIVMKKHQHHTNHANGQKIYEDGGRKQSRGEDKPSTMINPQENRTRNRTEQERRNVNNYLARNQQKVQDHAEDKSFAEQKPQQLQKHNLVAKHQQVDHMNAPKSKKSAAMNLQKKLPTVPDDGRSNKPNEKTPMKDPPNRRHQDAAIIIDSSHRTAANQESLKTESEPQNDIEKGSSNPLLTEEKPIEVSATQKRSITRKVQRREIPEKIEAVMSRRNATATRLTRSNNRPSNMLKDLKQQMKNTNRGSTRMEEPSDIKAEEGKEVISAYNASDKTIEPVKPEEKLETKYDRTIISNSIVPDEVQNQNIQNKLHLQSNSDSIVTNSRDVLNGFQEEKQPSAPKDEKGLKKFDQSIETHEERTELDLPQHGYMQFPALDRQEQLTEPEKNLKEIVIKSQLFLSTAEALFKLNIPVSFLHAGDHEKEAGETKLVLDSAYEVMKRKARRHEVIHHPYMKTTISSTKLRNLDDLVRQLCKYLEILKSYGMSGSDECDVAAGLHRMLNRDIYNESPDVNCMWDYEWSRMMSIFPEMEEVVKDVERHMLNGLLDEITSDLLIITVSV